MLPKVKAVLIAFTESSSPLDLLVVPNRTMFCFTVLDREFRSGVEFDLPHELVISTPH